MNLTTKSQYALVALSDMRKQEKLDADRGLKKMGPVRLQEISERTKISIHYLEQLFRKLRIAKIVKSVRGPGGGYVLLMPNVAYSDVLIAVGEEVEVSKSTFDADVALGLNAAKTAFQNKLNETFI